MRRLFALPLALALAAPGWAAQRSAVPSIPTTTVQPLNLVIMGPPASGKGTYAKMIAADYGMVHVSAGDLLREYAKTDPVIAETMKRGDLVPVPLVVGLMAERIKQPDVQRKGFIIDGFPRRLAEAKAFKEMLEWQGVRIDAAIQLDAPEPVLLQRILSRGRADDTEPTFRNRMKVYRKETVPAMRHVSRGTDLLKPRLTGRESVDEAYAKVKALLDSLSSPTRRQRFWRALKRRLL